MVHNPSFEPSAHGRIEQLFLSIPSWVLRYQRQVEVQGTAAVFRSVFAAFGESVQFLVVTHEEGVSHLVGWLRELGVRDRSDVVSVPNGAKLSVWAEDKFTLCTDISGSRWLLHPISQEHPGDVAAVKAVAKRLGLEYLEVDTHLRSGNLLAGDDFWFVGADSAPALSSLGLLDASRKLHIIESRVPVPGFDQGYELRNIELDGQQWREFCYRGNSANTTQPIFHIDAFVTLAGRGADGRNQLLVGDPAMAAEALGVDLPKHAASAAFDDIAARLKESGFSVIRNPLPLVYQDNHITKARHWYFASTNNAIVEIAGERKTVWLPSYGHGRWGALHTTDEINRDIWSGLGFETRLLGDFHTFAVNLGALHCMAKCLVRSM